MDDALWRSARNLRLADSQLNAVTSEIETLLQDATLSFVVDFKDFKEGNLASDKSPWVYSYYWWRYGIRAKASRGLAKQGYIAFALSLWRAEDDLAKSWVGAQTAKMYVVYTPWNVEDFSEYIYLDGAAKNPRGQAKLPFLWTFEFNEDMKRTPFFFCLPLLKMDTRETLRREAIVPLSILLKPGPINQSLAFEHVQHVFKLSK